MLSIVLSLSLIFFPGALRQCAALLGQQPVSYPPPSSDSSTVNKVTYSTPVCGHISALGKAQTVDTVCGGTAVRPCQDTLRNTDMQS